MMNDKEKLETVIEYLEDMLEDYKEQNKKLSFFSSYSKRLGLNEARYSIVVILRILRKRREQLNEN